MCSPLLYHPTFCGSCSRTALRSVAALVAVFTRSGSPVRIKARDTSTIRENRVQPRLRLTSSRLRLTSNVWFTASENSILSITTKASRSPRPSESTPTAPRLAPSALHPLHCPGGHTPMISPHHLMHARHARRLSGTRPSSPHHPAPRLWQRDQRLTVRLQYDFNDQGVCFYPAPCHMADGASLTRSRRRCDLAPQPPCSRLLDSHS